VVAVVGGVLMWVLDHSEYPNIGRGLWWAMQTVTTIGYGDVTPSHTSGRIVAVVVMLWGSRSWRSLSPQITSTFVSRAARERERAVAHEEEREDDRIEARFDELVARLDRLEALLARPPNGHM
jgi:hypothetical protein